MTTKIEFLDGRVITLTGVNRYNPAVHTIEGDEGGTVRDYGTFATIRHEGGGSH